MISPIIHPIITSTMYGTTEYSIVKSEDGGNSLFYFFSGIEEVSVTRIAVDPHDPRRYYVVAAGGIGYTENDGESWFFPVIEGTFGNVTIDPINPDIIYAPGLGGSGVHKSINNGVTWTHYLVDDNFGSIPSLNQLVLDPIDPLIGYLAVHTQGPPSAGTWGGVYKTENGGISWISTTLYDVPIYSLLLINDTQTLYAGGGNTWDNETIGGVYQSNDGGETWTRMGLDDFSITKLIINPVNPNNIFAVSIGALFKSEDSGENWEILSYDGVRDFTIDPENPNIFYKIVGNDIYRSINSGITWDLLYQHQPTDGIPNLLYIPWLPPSPVLTFTARVSDEHTIVLSWDSPDDSDFSGTLVRYMTTTLPMRYDEGTVVTDQLGSPSSQEVFTHTGTFSDTTLYYSAFAYDSDGYFAIPAQISITVGSKPGSYIFSLPTASVQGGEQSWLYLGNSRGIYRQIVTGSYIIYLPMVISSGQP